MMRLLTKEEIKNTLNHKMGNSNRQQVSYNGIKFLFREVVENHALESCLDWKVISSSKTALHNKFSSIKRVNKI